LFEPRDLVVAWFPGARQAKRRPVVVLSSALYNAARPDIIYGLVTSRAARATGPTDCLLEDWSAYGLRVPSAFRAFIETLPVTEEVRHISRLSERDWEAVRGCVRRALAPLEDGTE